MQNKAVDELLAVFDLSYGTLKDLSNELKAHLELGLSADKKSSCKMVLTYVHSIPDGTESGDFFALDLGGTNFRVLYVKISDKKILISSKSYIVDQEKTNGTAEVLFGFIADCLVSFAKEQLGAAITSISAVGFTFSFPVIQDSLVQGRLIEWTKGYNVKGVKGNDIIKLLHEALERKNEVQVEKIYLCNDTTGTMMSCAYDDSDVAIGLILGTGTNACYMEKTNRIGKWTNDTRPEEVIVNTEWGGFDLGCMPSNIKTKFDYMVDECSLYPGQQIFEKMISGMYLGELVRLCMVSLIEKDVLFSGVKSKEIQTQDSIQTSHISAICSGKAKEPLQLLKSLGYNDATLVECMVLYDVCVAISKRAAKLTGAGLSAIICRLERPIVTVAIDGSLFRKHPTFQHYLEVSLKELLPATTCVKLKVSEDGSGRGAALVAAVAKRLENGFAANP